MVEVLSKKKEVMAYLFDGGFTGFLYSMKETGRRLKDGAKELVEDFISGFNGHGWKLWKKNGGWRLELDDLLVRRSFTTFEHIISQVTSIKGAQSITQGHAKIKSVSIKDADIYSESSTDVYSENFLNSKWVKSVLGGDSPNMRILSNSIQCTPTTNAYTQSLMVTGDTEIASFKASIRVYIGTGALYAYYKEGTMETISISETGEYDLPASDGTGDSSSNAGFLFYGRSAVIVSQIAESKTYTSSVSTGQCYCLEIDDEFNSIMEFDFIQCLKNDRQYLVQVGSVYQYFINIPVSEFDVDDDGNVINAPQAGDEVVQFGNASHQDKYINRHSAIYIHTDEDEPAIDLMTDMYSKDWSEAIKCRLGGNLPGTKGERGLYSVNGKLLFVDDNGNTITSINPDGSASFARGKISWTKDGIPYFSGRITVGEGAKKRVEINPETAEIDIYTDNDVLVNTIESNTYNAENDIFDTSLPSFTENVSEKTISQSNADEKVLSTKSYSDSIEETYFTINSGIVIDIGEITLTPTFSGNGTFSSHFELVLQSFDSSDINKKMIYERTIYSVDMDQSVSSKTVKAMRITINNSGTYRLYARYSVSCSSYDGNTSTASLVYHPSSFAISSRLYVSKIFGNGIALGLDVNNMFMVYYDTSEGSDKKMNMKYDNGDAGISCVDKELKLKSNPLNVNNPIFAYPLKYAEYGSTFVYNDGRISNIVRKSFDSANNITVTRTTNESGYFILDFAYPSGWSKYSFGSSAKIETSVDIYGTNVSVPPTAYVYDQNSSGFKVIVYKTNSSYNSFILNYKILLL